MSQNGLTRAAVVELAPIVPCPVIVTLDDVGVVLDGLALINVPTSTTLTWLAAVKSCKYRPEGHQWYIKDGDKMTHFIAKHPRFYCQYNAIGGDMNHQINININGKENMNDNPIRGCLSTLNRQSLSLSRGEISIACLYSDRLKSYNKPDDLRIALINNIMVDHIPISSDNITSMVNRIDTVMSKLTCGRSFFAEYACRLVLRIGAHVVRLMNKSIRTAKTDAIFSGIMSIMTKSTGDNNTSDSSTAISEIDILAREVDRLEIILTKDKNQ